MACMIEIQNDIKSSGIEALERKRQKECKFMIILNKLHSKSEGSMGFMRLCFSKQRTKPQNINKIKTHKSSFFSMYL